MMANPRDTRCISAAFSFLGTTDFCPKCIHGYETGKESSSDANTTTGVPKLKKSESIDSALSGHQQLNVKNAERLKVCVCEYQSGLPEEQHNGDIFKQQGENTVDAGQGYETRGAPQSGENNEAVSHKEQALGIPEEGKALPQDCFDSEEAASSVEDFKDTVIVNGNAENQRASSPAPKNETVEDSSLDPVPGVNGCASVISADACDRAHSLLNLASQGEDSCTMVISNSGACVLGRTCANGCRGTEGTDQGDLSQPSPNTGCQEVERNEEQEEEEVVMRPNRKSLHRCSTDTEMISSAFNFLPSTGSVVFSAADPAMQVGATTLSGTQRTPVGGTNDLKMSANHVEENVHATSDFEPQQANSHDVDCCGISLSTPQEPDKKNEVFPSHSPFCLPSMAEDVEEKDSAGNHQEADQSSCDVAVSKPAMSEEDGMSEVRLRRSQLTKKAPLTEDYGSGDSSDEDAGVYAESFRRSNWIRIDDDGQLELAFPAVDTSRLSLASKSSAASRSSGLSVDTTDSARTPSPRVITDEPPVFPEKCPSPRLYLSHKRSDSTSTTLSEHEFKKEYLHRRKCLIQRQNSSKEYQRYSAQLYDEEKSVVLEKAPEETDFGLHILDSQPAYITWVDPGSAADRAGVEEGQILVSVNGTNVLTLTHAEIVTIITNSPAVLRFDVATTAFQPSRDLQASIIEGHMQKLGGSSSVFIRRWKKRYFILRQDSCLYYYKHKSETDPLGAIPLAGYTFSRHLDTGRDFCFKAEKYGARTYYFMTDSRDDMTEWVGALSEAAARSKKRKESFVSVSSHNVGLPALEVRRPECTGYLLKVGNRHKTWKRRYFILKDACLYYYRNMNSLSALGVAHLHGYKVDPSISIGKKHAFGLVPPDDTLRTFHFSAENDTDRQRWVDAMIRSIQRWVQIDNDC